MILRESNTKVLEQPAPLSLRPPKIPLGVKPDLTIEVKLSVMLSWF